MTAEKAFTVLLSYYTLEIALRLPYKKYWKFSQLNQSQSRYLSPVLVDSLKPFICETYDECIKKDKKNKYLRTAF